MNLFQLHGGEGGIGTRVSYKKTGSYDIGFSTGTAGQDGIGRETGGGGGGGSRVDSGSSTLINGGLGGLGGQGTSYSGGCGGGGGYSSASNGTMYSGDNANNERWIEC